MTRREDAHLRMLDAFQRLQSRAADWLDLVRQDTEQRLGSYETEDVIEDPDYCAALKVYGAITDTQEIARRSAA
ncbi:hypothetical protein [Amycolatopsis cihanbeyliensis]|uniref:Uncharacterized protein n=1 Tax=Amycolatopsis cihanbeyliensis TaxID=1128664 RepID=A0A542DQR8_AMYCI|nr:hypothetical protein [Amycolatopsis cihanbeyliensis]TQJ05448.1 hypothetical protein FB471_5279 [Amycolatopsis cihanbeyliensis]